MTSIKWLIEKLHNKQYGIFDGIPILSTYEIYAKAIEMHMQEIVNTYIIADSESTQEDSEHNALKFYERTYGSNGSDATSSKTTSDKWKEYQDWLNNKID
jgi:hypothetical protein